MSRFDEFFTRLLGNEGGYVNKPEDPGGETNWGISKRSYPNVDIKSLTKEDAKAIYYRDFWQAAQMDQYDPAIAFQVFDAAVNHGLRPAVRFLQQAAQVTPDGVVGAQTVKAVQATDKNDILLRFIAYRLKFWADLNTWTTFGRGWARRAADDLIYAAGDN